MTSGQKMTLRANDDTAEQDTWFRKLCLGWECGAVVEFVVDVVVVVPVVAPSGRGDAVASPRPAVADPRVSRGTTWAAAWRPATERMNIFAMCLLTN